MKKFISFGLVLTMALGILTGCGSSGSSVSSDSADGTKHIVVTWVYYTEAAPDLADVTAAVNDITVPEIGVEVEFMPISIGDTFQKYGTYIASGEEIDCMLLLFQDPIQYYNNGSVEPLNDLLDEYGSTILALSEEFPITAQLNDDIYGFAPVDQYYGFEGCVYVKEQYADCIADYISDDENHIYTTDELTQIFAAIKDEYPEVYPFNTVGADNTSSQLASGFVSGMVFDKAGGDFGNGVFLGVDSETVVDYFETEEYYNYIKQVKEWADAGYILPDAAVTDSTSNELVSSDVTATAITSYNPIVYGDEQSILGEGVVVLKTTKPYYQSTAAGSVTWTIPVTAKEPEAAMKFYNLLYENTELANLIMWGIEGQHYVKTDVEQVIAFPDGIDSTNSGYYNTFGVWGDRREQYVWTESATKEPNEIYTEAAQSNPTMPGRINYQYDSSNMTNALSAVDAVINQYAPALECGSVSDVDTTYKEFISALKAAGIDDIIADNQAQYDAAKAAN